MIGKTQLANVRPMGDQVIISENTMMNDIPTIQVGSYFLILSLTL